ncbi:hypothetical protein, partial [Streptomyces sp. NPDC046870]|uniref:hypothetical protein n=1 Tax=Streptomyces sp. NPDC046870 TaxID=3155135 RepID=UPI0034569F2A
MEGRTELTDPTATRPTPAHLPGCAGNCALGPHAPAAWRRPELGGGSGRAVLCGGRWCNSVG